MVNNGGARLFRWLLIATPLVGLQLSTPTVVAQVTLPGHEVRVTVRDSTGVRRMTGHLFSATPDTLVLQISESDSFARIDRHAIVRLERPLGGPRSEVSIGKAMIIGCLALGGVFALIGSQAHDADSPGIEKTLAAVGLVVGCGLGAGVGFVVGSLGGRQRWEEFTL